MFKVLNLTNEDVLIRLDEVPTLPFMGRRGDGREFSKLTVHKWASHGVRGCQLPVVRIGLSLYTTQEAVREFLMALTRAERAAGAVARAG